MMMFRKERLRNLLLPADVVRMMIEIAESKGRQQFYEKQKPQLLRALRSAASVRGVESSNRIAGVTVEPARLPILTSEQDIPRNRPEELIQGYARALKFIYSESGKSRATPDFILKLHRLALGTAGDAGQWRSAKHETVADGESESGSRFRSFSDDQIPVVMKQLCAAYGEEIDAGAVHPLLAVATLVFDFLRISPFSEGNGRISRLLAIAALYEQGFEIGRYVSLERFVEQSLAEYFEAMRVSSKDWVEGTHNILPWLNYFFTVVQRGCREFERRTNESASARGTKIPLVEVAIDILPREFSREDLEKTCPGVSGETVGRALRQLRRNGSLICVQHGGMVTWRKAGDLLRDTNFRKRSTQTEFI